MIWKNPVQRALNKVESIFRRQKSTQIIIQRKYLPEVFDPTVIEFSDIDGLPILKTILLEEFKLHAIITFFTSTEVQFTKIQYIPMMYNTVMATIEQINKKLRDPTIPPEEKTILWKRSRYLHNEVKKYLKSVNIEHRNILFFEKLEDFVELDKIIQTSKTGKELLQNIKKELLKATEEKKDSKLLEWEENQKLHQIINKTYSREYKLVDVAKRAKEIAQKKGEERKKTYHDFWVFVIFFFVIIAITVFSFLFFFYFRL